LQLLATDVCKTNVNNWVSKGILDDTYHDTNLSDIEDNASAACKPYSFPSIHTHPYAHIVGNRINPLTIKIFILFTPSQTRTQYKRISFQDVTVQLPHHNARHEISVLRYAEINTA